MISTYKIGYSNYFQNNKLIDKNSGIFEFDIIYEELSYINSNRTVLVIVNGKFTAGEEEHLLKLMQAYDVCIFIASDIIAFSDNKSIIENCDYLLHQCPKDTIKDFSNIQQFYSWVPELFYKYTHSRNNAQVQKIIFGGGVRDNENLINAYLNAVPSTSYLKTNDTDNRLTYHDYMNELSRHQYSLIVSRKQYSDMNWVTARYAEALAVHVLPICDAQYDKANHFASIRVFSPDDLKSVFDMFSKNTAYMAQTLNYMRSSIEKNIDNFQKLIIKLVGD